MMNRRFLRQALAILALALPCCPSSPAQARRTATKSADVSIFAGYQVADPDYGFHNSNGGMFGVDFTRYLYLPIEPSLEFRANLHSSDTIGEHSYVVGLKLAVPIRSLHPYADFLVGPGTVNFPQNVGFTHDDSLVYSYGGGLDLHLTGPFALKLDAQGQHWNTGELTLTPTLGTIGLTYTLPFRPHVGHH